MENNEQRGNLIVIYGINTLGKTTQAKLLVESLILKIGKNAEYLKYAVYDLAPSGPLINSYLKQGNPHKFSAREFQFLQILNRTQYEPKLKEKLNKGTWIIAEDYTGSGIAWGMAEGIDKELLYNMNSHLRKEDLGILFEGEPFAAKMDKKNIHETDSQKLAKAATAYKEIARDFGWHVVDANQTVEEVQENIIQIINSKLTTLN